jgi:hypothetical protein
MKNEPRFPNMLLIAGILLILGGSIFLLWTLGLFPEFLSWLIALWPIPFIIAGLVMLYLVYLKGKSHQLLLPGMILLLGGIFFLLYNTVIPDKSFERVWPVVIAIAGIALFPYAFKMKKRARVGILISAAVLLCLATMFLPFSLKLIEIDFLHFVIRWWPALIIIIGGVLVVSFAVNKKKPKPTRAAKAKEPPAEKTK